METYQPFIDRIISQTVGRFNVLITGMMEGWSLGKMGLKVLSIVFKKSLVPY